MKNRRYVVKCDICKAPFKENVSFERSVAGGKCPACRKKELLERRKRVLTGHDKMYNKALRLGDKKLQKLIKERVGLC